MGRHLVRDLPRDHDVGSVWTDAVGSVLPLVPDLTFPSIKPSSKVNVMKFFLSGLAGCIVAGVVVSLPIEVIVGKWNKRRIIRAAAGK